MQGFQSIFVRAKNWKRHIAATTALVAVLVAGPVLSEPGWAQSQRVTSGPAVAVAPAGFQQLAVSPTPSPPTNSLPGGGGLSSWKDHKGRTIYFRDDAIAKAYGHGLDTNPVRVTTQYPVTSEAGSGTSWVYRQLFVRTNGSIIVASVYVRVVVDFKKYGSETFGVVTAYCEGSSVCPSWVNQTVG